MGKRELVALLSLSSWCLVIDLLYVTLCPFWLFCNHLDGEERAGCFA